MGSTMHVSNLRVVAKFHVDAYKSMGDNVAVADPTLTAALEYVKKLTDGRAADQADLVYVTSFSLAASANKDIDLSGSTDKTVFGDSLAFSKVRGIILFNDSALDADVLRLGGYGAGAFASWINDVGSYVTVGPGMWLISRSDLTAYAVAATTGDILRITNPGSRAIAGRIAIWGCETDVSSSSSSSTSGSSSSTSTSTSSGSSSTSTSTSSTTTSTSSSTAGEVKSSSSSSSSSSVQESSESSSSSTTSSSSGV